MSTVTQTALRRFMMGQADEISGTIKPGTIEAAYTECRETAAAAAMGADRLAVGLCLVTLADDGEKTPQAILDQVAEALQLDKVEKSRTKAAFTAMAKRFDPQSKDADGRRIEALSLARTLVKARGFKADGTAKPGHDPETGGKIASEEVDTVSTPKKEATPQDKGATTESFMDRISEMSDSVFLALMNDVMRDAQRRANEGSILLQGVVSRFPIQGEEQQAEAA